jgi:hypothetical protein
MINWRFWKKKLPKCFGTQGHTIMPREYYLAQHCSDCDHSMPCFVKSLPVFTVRFGEDDLAKWL